MAENCPLKEIIPFEDGADSSATQWEPGIPAECWTCLNNALSQQNPARQEESFQPELYEGERALLDEGQLDLYTIYGIRQLPSGKRLAIVEVGIDDNGWNEGSLLSRTTAPLECTRE